MTHIVAIVGLGYVGLPLAVEFSKHYSTIGYDLSRSKIDSYSAQRDSTGQVAAADFAPGRPIQFSSDAALLRQADVVIVAVPTPIDAAHRPDFGPLLSARRTVAENLKCGAHRRV